MQGASESKCMTATRIPRKRAIDVRAEAPCSQLLGAMSSGLKNRRLLVDSARVICARSLNQVLGRWQGQFQGQKWGQWARRNLMPVVYLAFSRGEVAERLKAAVC